MENYILKNKKVFIQIMSVIFSLTIILCLFFGTGYLKVRATFIVVYFISLGMTYLMFSLLIGFQFINPFSTDNSLRFCCNFFMYLAFIWIIGSIIGVAVNIKFILTEEYATFYFTAIYMTTGAFLAALKCKDKFNKRQIGKARGIN